MASSRYSTGQGRESGHITSNVEAPCLTRSCTVFVRVGGVRYCGRSPLFSSSQAAAGRSWPGGTRVQGNHPRIVPPGQEGRQPSLGGRVVRFLLLAALQSTVGTANEHECYWSRSGRCEPNATSHPESVHSRRSARVGEPERRLHPRSGDGATGHGAASTPGGTNSCLEGDTLRPVGVAVTDLRREVRDCDGDFGAAVHVPARVYCGLRCRCESWWRAACRLALFDMETSGRRRRLSLPSPGED
jgi:hypothetical protein